MKIGYIAVAIIFLVAALLAVALERSLKGSAATEDGRAAHNSQARPEVESRAGEAFSGEATSLDRAFEASRAETEEREGPAGGAVATEWSEERRQAPEAHASGGAVRLSVSMVGAVTGELRPDVIVARIVNGGEGSLVKPSGEVPPGVDFLATVTSGQYVARAVLPVEGVSGEPVTFFVQGEPLSVEVPAPRNFDVTFELRDSATGLPITGANVLLTRSRSELGPQDRQRVESDAVGNVRFQDCWEGNYAIAVAADGYVPEKWVEPLPGRFTPWLIGGELDLRYRNLQPQTIVRFRLVGHDGWGPVQAFSLAHGSLLGEQPVAFGSDAEAELVLDRFSIPLEVVLTYPGGARDIIYLPQDRKLDEGVHTLSVQRSHSLVVDVRVSPSLEDELFSSPVFIQASYTDDGGSSRQINHEIVSEGAATLEGPFAAVAVVSVVQVDAASQIAWSARRVSVDGLESNVILNVTSPPIGLQVLGRSGSPCRDAYVLLSMAPDETNWIAGGAADESGVVLLPPVESAAAVVTCYVGDELRAMDHSVVLDGVRRRVQLHLGKSTNYSFAVHVDGVEDPGALVFLQGALTKSIEGQNLRTHIDGVRRTIALTNESMPMVTPVVDNAAWVVDRAIPLSAGLNELHVRSTGRLVCADRERLIGAASLELGEGVAEWIAGGRTECVEVGTRFSVRVPIGSYLVETPDGGSAQVLVEAGEESVFQ